MSATDTIFALSTAPGRAGVAVLRVSGSRTAEAAEALSRDVLPRPRAATLKRFRDGAGAVIDRGLLLWFPAPNSFTGEDMAEFHVHGGRAVVQAMVEALAAIPGLRPAEAGEFTRRAMASSPVRQRYSNTALCGLHCHHPAERPWPWAPKSRD